MQTRLLERGKTSGRDDDNVESIRKRLGELFLLHLDKPTRDAYAFCL